MSDTKNFSDLERRITSHASIITVDRPDSSQLVDLHVYFLPRSFWKDKLNLAYNDAMEEAISAGFVRVRNQLTLQELRNEIDGQCGMEIDYFPKEYIYLRSVGRALTRVKEKQEYELKVKNFRPPQTYAPEIFILEARHEDFNGMNSSLMSPSQTSLLTSRQKVVPTKSSVMDHNKSLEPIKSLSTTRIDDKDYDAYEWIPSTNNSSRGPRLDRSKELQKLQEEQDRLKKRQSELERLRQEAEERQRRQNEDLRRKQQQQQQPQLHHYQQQQFESPKHVQLQNQKQNQSPQHQYNQQQPQKQQQQQQQQHYALDNDYDRYRQQQEAATKIQKTYRGYRDRKKVKKIKNDKLEELNRRPSTNKERLLREQEQAAKRKEKENELNRKNNNNSRIANSLQSNDVDYLRKKLESVKTSRSELETLRDDLIKRLKQIHNRITLRRKEARDLWKKKYFAEKKKTPPLEEKVDAQVTEIEGLQKRIYTHIEAETKNNHDNENGGVKLASIKLQQEIDGIKRQVEQAKLRLTTDIKLRNQAETEIKALRSELGQTKLNLHHIKSKILSSNNDFNELMTTRE